MNYKAFGESGGDRSTYMFAGREWNQSSGVYLNGRRYYDPSLGRFITPEVTLGDLGDPQSLNHYSYAGNNPISFRDVTGRWPDDYEPNVKLRMPDDLRLKILGGMGLMALTFGLPATEVVVGAEEAISGIHVLVAGWHALKWGNFAWNGALITADSILRIGKSDEEIRNLEEDLGHYTLLGAIWDKGKDLLKDPSDPKEAFNKTIERGARRSLRGEPLKFKSADTTQREINEAAEKEKAEPKDRVAPDGHDRGHDPDPGKRRD